MSADGSASLTELEKLAERITELVSKLDADGRHPNEDEEQILKTDTCRIDTLLSKQKIENPSSIRNRLSEAISSANSALVMKDHAENEPRKREQDCGVNTAGGCGKP